VSEYSEDLDQTPRRLSLERAVRLVHVTVFSPGCFLLTQFILYEFPFLFSPPYSFSYLVPLGSLRFPPCFIPRFFFSMLQELALSDIFQLLSLDGPGVPPLIFHFIALTIISAHSLFVVYLSERSCSTPFSASPPSSTLDFFTPSGSIFPRDPFLYDQGRSPSDTASPLRSECRRRQPRPKVLAQLVIFHLSLS